MPRRVRHRRHLRTGLLRRNRSAFRKAPRHRVLDMVGNEGWSIDPHRVSKATDELSRRVAIQADLTWHFGPGDKSEHRPRQCER